MRDRLWILFAVLIGVSFSIQVALPVDLSERPETSFETAPRGHAALFELLSRFNSVRGRWRSGLSMPAIEDPLWFIASEGICDAGSGSGEAPRANTTGRDAPFRSTVEPWIESGGTAIVWLSHPPLDDGSDPLKGSPDAPATDTLEVSYRRLVAGGGREKDEIDGEPRAEPDPDEEAVDGPEAIREEWHESVDSTRRDLREGEARRCRGVAGFPLPARRWAGLEGGEIPEDADYAATVFQIGRYVDSRVDFDYGAARSLPGSTIAFFETRSPALTGWRPLWVEADDFSPFALERSVGSGHLIVVADARVLTNGRLARGDSAPFVFDWVEDWGAPWIDEHRHGVVPEDGIFRYLATSPAWAVCLGLIVLAGLVIWRGHAWPYRRVEEVDPEAPTLSAFVDSVASLYSGTGDPAHAFERYRALSLDRVRRALGLTPGTPSELVMASLRARAANRPSLREKGLRDLLTKDLRIENASEFERAAARLDELVRVLHEENGQRSTGRRTRL